MNAISHNPESFRGCNPVCWRFILTFTSCGAGLLFWQRCVNLASFDDKVFVLFYKGMFFFFVRFFSNYLRIIFNFNWVLCYLMFPTLFINYMLTNLRLKCVSIDYFNELHFQWVWNCTFYFTDYYFIPFSY